MTTLSELQADLAALQAKIEAFEKVKEWPSIGNNYFCIMSNGEIDTSEWCDHIVDRGRLEMGNVFLTREEAELEVKRRKVTVKLKAIAAKYPPCDWKNRQETKYGIFYDYRSGTWQRGEFISYQYQGQICAPNERYITEVLALGDELNVLIEG